MRDQKTKAQIKTNTKNKLRDNTHPLSKNGRLARFIKEWFKTFWMKYIRRDLVVPVLGKLSLQTRTKLCIALK